MNDFLKTKKGLEYLLKTFPSDMSVQTVITDYSKIENYETI